MLTEFEKLLNESNLNFEEGSIISVLVKEITHKSIIVDFSFKSKSSIDIEEFKSYNGEINVSVNDNINVFIEKLDDGEGQSILSYKKANEKTHKNNIIKSFELNDKYIEVVGKRMVNKGYVADYNGIEIFIPFSLLDVKKINNFDFLNNQKFSVKVIKYDFEKNSIFASRKYYIEKELGINIEEEFNKINTGDKIKGTVKSFMRYGVFIDLGFTDSLLHANDISWLNKNIELKEGEEVEVIVTGKDIEKNRIFISLKDIDTTPWDNFINEVKKFDLINVKIEDIKDNGIIVSYNNNISFFIHYSELSWYSLKKKIDTVHSLGEILNVKVENIDFIKKQVSLKLKKISEDPIIVFAKENKVGEIFNADIIDVGNYFIKLKIKSGVYGSLFSEELSWNFDSKDSLKKYKKGDKIKVSFKGLDTGNRILKFSLKDVLENPYKDYANLSKGSFISVKVSEIKTNWIIVETDNGLKTLVKNTTNDKYSIGQEIKLKIRKSNNHFLELEF